MVMSNNPSPYSVIHSAFVSWLIFNKGTPCFHPQKCLSKVWEPLVDLVVSEYGILPAIATLSDTQNNLGLNHQQPSSCPEPCYSVLFQQITLDLREFKQGDKIISLVCVCWTFFYRSVDNMVFMLPHQLQTWPEALCFRLSARLSHSCECNISETLEGNFLKSGTDVNLD